MEIPKKKLIFFNFFLSRDLFMKFILKLFFPLHSKIIIFSILFLLHSNLSSSAQTQPELKVLNQAIQKLQSAQSLSTNFEQKQKNITLGITKSSLGTILLKKQKKDVVQFRFETNPEKSLLVSDGKKIWYFLPPNPQDSNEKGLLTIRKADTLKSQPALRILAGFSKLEEEFKVVKLDTELRFRLIPKPNSNNKRKNHNDLQYIELELEKRTNLVYKISLKNQLGNETELEFKELKLDAPLTEKSFQFIPPPGVKFDTETID